MELINLTKVEILELNLSNINDILKIEKQLNIHILSKENIIKDLANSNFKYFIAKYNNELIAYASISYVDDIEIESIVVKKEYQRLKVGSLLLNNILKFAKRNNVKNIFLEVRKSNTPAQNLYLNNGFNVISIRKSYYFSPIEDALILKKVIQY